VFYFPCNHGLRNVHSLLITVCYLSLPMWLHDAGWIPSWPGGRKDTYNHALVLLYLVLFVHISCCV